MAELALLGWGIMIGVVIAPSFPWPKRTQAREALADAGEAWARQLKRVYDMSRFAGAGHIVTRQWTTETDFGRFEVTIRRLDDGDVIDL